MPAPPREPFNGPKRRLVLAFDLGTTYSGISYSVLDPGQVPKILGVTRYPGVGHVSGAAKIPTIMYYDKTGKVCVAGAEAIEEGVEEKAVAEGWVKAEWFKLLLRPKGTDGKSLPDEIAQLPFDKSIVEVYSDFLRYLFNCASSFIRDTHLDGPNLWSAVQDDITFVLSHPNGWGGAQQSQIREAAVLAQLVPDTAVGHGRILFVTEGEASLHFSIHNGLSEGTSKKANGIVIVDAGGGTVDISAYANSKGRFEEITVPQCHFQGSVFVTLYARVFLESLLADSPFLDDIDHIVECFDKSTKLRFRNPQEAQFIKFGSKRDNDETYNIRFGQLKVQGADIAMFFQPSINCIVKVVTEQRKVAHKPISHVVLLGGFSASDYLFDSLNTALSASGLNVLRPTNHVNKAVSEGAVSFYLDRFVGTRISKVTYGTFYSIRFESFKPEHRARKSKSFLDVDGERRLMAFNPILPKNVQVSETKEFEREYVQRETAIEDFRSLVPIFYYSGNLPKPKWRDADPENYSHLCDIQVDFSNYNLLPRRNGSAIYYEIQYKVILLFGLTELKAQISWKERGVEKRTTPKIIYDLAGRKATTTS